MNNTLWSKTPPNSNGYFWTRRNLNYAGYGNYEIMCHSNGRFERGGWDGNWSLTQLGDIEFYAIRIDPPEG